MPQDVINFGPNQESSYDELGGASPSAINVVVDKNGAVYKRPGIATYSESPSSVINSSGIVGIYSTNDGQLFAIGNEVNSRSIYKISGGSAAEISIGPNEHLLGNGRPIFTETEVYAVIAGGLDLQRIVLSSSASERTWTNAPLATHVVANTSRLLANDAFLDKTKVRYSGVSQGTVDTSLHLDWTNTGVADEGGFFTAEARPDNVVAVAENTNEVFVWGTDNVQMFQPDAELIFAPTATREFGTCAPYSIIKKDQDFFWLDQYRRFVYSDGRQFQNIEKPIKKKLDALSRVDDCFGYRVLLGHIDCMVWCFPTAGTTFVYQIGGGWSEWNGWDSSTSNFKVLQILSHHLRRDGGINVVGTVGGKVGKLSQTAYDDLGELIVSRTDSGFVDRGTPNRKLSRSIKIEGRRGQTSSESLGRIEWRDNLGNWNGPLFVDFGTTGDYDIVKEFRGLGTYNRRQWRFTFSDSANLSLIRVTETFDILGV